MKPLLFSAGILCALMASGGEPAAGKLNTPDKVVSFQKWEGEKDLSADWSLQVRAEGVLLKIKVQDDVHCNAPAGHRALWEVDGIQIAFASMTAKNCQVEFCVYSDADGKPAYHFFTPSNESFRKCDIRIQSIPGGKEYLISVPWQSLLPLNPFEEKKFRANFIVNDNDGKGRKGYIELAKGIGESKSTVSYPVFEMPADLWVNAATAGKVAFVYPVSKLLDPAKKSRLMVYTANVPAFPVGFAAGENKNEVNIDTSAGRLSRRIVSVKIPAGKDVADVIAAGQVIARRRVVNLTALNSRYGALAHWCATVKADTPEKVRRQAVVRASLPTLKQFISDGLVVRAERNLSQLEAIAADKSSAAMPELAKELGCSDTPATGEITLGDGWFYRGGRPVWLSGYNGFVRIHRSYAELEKMGTAVMGADLNGDSFIREDPAQDKTPNISGWFRGMRKHDLWLFGQVPFHYLPKWVGKKYPEGRVANTFWHFSSFHPAAREVEGRYLERGAAAFASGSDRIPFVNLTNEPFVFDFSDTGRYALQAYRAYLQKKFGEISELNKCYGTSYRDFKEVPIPWTFMSEPDFSKVPFAAWVDYMNFRRDGVADFFLWMNRKWRSVSKIPVTHKLLGGSFSAESFIGHAAYRAGIDFETILRDSDLAGHDLAMGYLTVGEEKIGDSGIFLVNFFNHHFGIDLLRSLSGRKILVNTENHLVPNARQELHYSAEFIQTMLFSQVLHGLAGHTFWVYENIQSTKDLSDTALSRPPVLLGVAEATAKVNRLMPLIARSLGKPQAAIYYSWPSMIGPSRHFKSALEAYKTLLFRGLDIGFISEKMLANGDFGDVKLLICADAPRFDDAAAAGLGKFMQKGGKVLFVNENFCCDHYDRKKTFDDSGIRRVPAEKLRAAVSEELRNMGITPALTAPDGGELIGVEWKCISAQRKDGKKYKVFLVVNWLKQPVAVKFPGEGIDLLSGKKFEMIAKLPSGMIGAVAVAE